MNRCDHDSPDHQFNTGSWDSVKYKIHVIKKVFCFPIQSSKTHFLGFSCVDFTPVCIRHWHSDTTCDGERRKNWNIRIMQLSRLSNNSFSAFTSLQQRWYVVCITKIESNIVLRKQRRHQRILEQWLLCL